MAESRPSFQHTQYDFAAAIRQPEEVPPPQGVTAERMNLYRELIYNNVESFIASGFPVLRELFADDSWAAMIRDFLARHRSTTPYFSGIPAEFLAYLRDERGDHPGDPPFLLELAHYEWLELAVSVDEGDTPPEDPALTADPVAHRLTLSPAAWPQVYRYPVQRISRTFQPEEPPPEPTHLAVYRDREDQVRFLELNAVTYRLLQIIGEQPGLPGLAYLERIAAELGHGDAAPLLGHGTELLRDLARRGVIGGA
jgi:hypothetical protein